MTAGLQAEARALGDPTRHAVFRYLVDAGRAVGVGELTAHFGLNHNAIRQHLAKLVAAGLVVESRAPATGPGRPPHVYAVAPTADSRWGAVGPYERLSHLLVEIIRSGLEPEEVGRRAAELLRGAPPSADALADLADAMAGHGFEPEIRRAGDRAEVVLHNCPFETAALADRDVVCSLHLGLGRGIAEGTDVAVDELVAYDPRRAGCRFRVRLGTDAGDEPPATLSLRERSTPDRRASGG